MRARPGPSQRTRPPLERLLRLREALRQGPVQAKRLAEALEVNERTIRRDLEFAGERLGWPIAPAPGRRGFMLTAPDAALPALAVTEGELFSLLVAERALRLYEGTGYADTLRRAFEKIVAALETPLSVSVAPAALPVFTADPTRPVDPALYNRLARACQQRERLELTYHSFSTNEVNTRRVDPLTLHAHAGDWYLVAYCHLRQGVRDFQLGERMHAVRETGERFTPDPAFDLAEYLRSGFGIFKGEAIEEVALRFAPDQARYMRERQWDSTEQREELPDGSLILRLRVPMTVGVKQFVLRFGSTAEVLAPAALREWVRGEVERVRQLYAVGEAASGLEGRGQVADNAGQPIGELHDGENARRAAGSGY